MGKEGSDLGSWWNRFTSGTKDIANRTSLGVRKKLQDNFGPGYLDSAEEVLARAERENKLKNSNKAFLDIWNGYTNGALGNKEAAKEGIEAAKAAGADVNGWA